MAISRKEVWLCPLPRPQPPIKYLTENGFSIVRGCDLDQSVRTSPNECRFLVAHNSTRERMIRVSFAESLIAELQVRRRIPFSEASLFWLVCAESCLANYLWEYDMLPPEG